MNGSMCARHLGTNWVWQAKVGLTHKSRAGMQNGDNRQPRKGDISQQTVQRTNRLKASSMQ